MIQPQGLPLLPALPGYHSLNSEDPDEVVDVVGRHLAPHRRKLVDRKQKIRASLGKVNLGEVSVVDIRYGAAVEIDPGDLPEQFLIHAAIAGASEIRAGGTSAVIKPGNLVVSSPTRKTDLRMTAECRHMVVRIGRQALEARLQTTLQFPLKKPILFDLEVRGETTLCQAWRGLILHIYQEALKSPDLYRHPSIQRQYAATLIEWLLSLHGHNYSAALDGRDNDISPWHVHRAREIIDDQLSEAISVAALAQAVGVSLRTLQNGFRRFLGVTPADYIRRRRLEQVHKALQQSVPGQNVTAIMLDHGIVNFGRFAQYYKQHYDCRPSDTLRRGKLN